MTHLLIYSALVPLSFHCYQQKFGARIMIHGAHIGEAKDFAETLVDSENLTYVNGYDDPAIVAGAGSMGIEMIDDVPEVDVVVVPVGGAGLIAGVSCAVKTLKPQCKVCFDLFGLMKPFSTCCLEWEGCTHTRVVHPFPLRI